jgi:hypothetical protein
MSVPLWRIGWGLSPVLLALSLSDAAAGPVDTAGRLGGGVAEEVGGAIVRGIDEIVEGLRSVGRNVDEAPPAGMRSPTVPGSTLPGEIQHGLRATARVVAPPPGAIDTTLDPSLSIYSGNWLLEPGTQWNGLPHCVAWSARSDLLVGPDKIVWTGTPETDQRKGLVERVLEWLDAILAATGGEKGVNEYRLLQQTKEGISASVLGTATVEQWASLTAIYIYEHVSDFRACWSALAHVART